VRGKFLIRGSTLGPGWAVGGCGSDGENAKESKRDFHFGRGGI